MQHKQKLLSNGLGVGNGPTKTIRLFPSFFAHCWTHEVQSRFTFLKTYNSRDVFSTTELKEDVIAQYADVTVDDGSIVHVWREPLAVKYSKMPGVRSLHDCVFSKHCVTGEVVARMRTLCYTGPFSPPTLHVLAGQNPAENIIPNDAQTYTGLNKTHSLSESKMSHLKQMY